jgi:lysophospholipase L1-like esterase
LPLALAADCAGELPLTYVSLGDSLAVGVGASDPQEHGYAPLYREFLERETGREVRLVQLGLSGETSERFVKGPGSQLARAEAALRKSPGATVTLSIFCGRKTVPQPSARQPSSAMRRTSTSSSRP